MTSQFTNFTWVPKYGGMQAVAGRVYHSAKESVACRGRHKANSRTPGSTMADSLRNQNQAKERYFLRNAALVAPVDLFWGFGTAITATGPILTVFLQQLGATNLVIGLAPVAFLMGNTLLQLPSAHLTRNLRRKRVFFALAHVVPCSAWIMAGLVTAPLAASYPGAMVWTLLAVIAAFSAANGFLMPMWTQLFPRLFSDNRRGLIGGLINLAAGFGGLAGGLYAAHVLAARAFPLGYAHLFLLAGVVELVSVQTYLFVHEEVPEDPRQGVEAPPEPRAGPGLLPSLRVLWREDLRLRRYLLVRNISEFGFAANAFFAVYAIQQFDLPQSVGGAFVIAANLGYAAMALFFGHLGDRRGYRRVVSWSLVCSAFSTLVALVSGEAWLFYLVFLFSGAGLAGDWMANVNLMIEMSTEERRGYYYGLFSTAMAPVRLVAPLAWGWLGDAMGLRWAFLGGLGLQVAGIILLLALVDDPRRPGQRFLRWRWRTWRPRLY
jgi:MFS family permease